jgi:hypothetical protein
MDDVSEDMPHQAALGLICGMGIDRVIPKNPVLVMQNNIRGPVSNITKDRRAFPLLPVIAA